MKRARHQQGSVVFNKRSRTWHYLWLENGHRRSQRLGHESELPTEASAWKAAEPFRRMVIDQRTKNAGPEGVRVRTLVEHYRKEKMPARVDARRSYEVWLRLYILPRFGDCLLTDVQARVVELWLNSLDLAPKK